MNVLVLPRYSAMAASSRYRFHLYYPYLERHGFQLTTEPLLGDAYMRQLYGRSLPGETFGKADTARAYAHRVGQIRGARKAGHELIWLQMEALPWIPGGVETALLKSSGLPYVADYDDAWFHRYDAHPNPVVRAALGQKIDAVMRHAALVVAGNEYIADRARKAGARRIELVPTVIDLDDYPLTPAPTGPTFTIGWIGSPHSDQWLQTIAPALARFCAEAPGARLVTVGAGERIREQLPGVPLEIRPWTKATEVPDMQSFDVGIMPLTDSLWERGKCGFKLIQNLACARPVIASPVGVNSEIVRPGETGFLAESNDEWVAALHQLRNDAAARARMGQQGRRLIEEKYALQVTAPRTAELLKGVILDKGL